LSYNNEIKTDIAHKNVMKAFMSQKLQEAVQILQLTREELIERIDAEIETNPVLEIVEIKSVQNKNTNKNEEPEEFSISEKIKEDIEWSYYENEYSSENFKSSKDKSSSITENIPSSLSIHEYLLSQLGEIFLSEQDSDRSICEFFIMNIDRNGYLRISESEAAKLLGIDKKKIKEIISKIQLLEPAGICARNFKECLLLQAKKLKPKNSVVEKIIKIHLNDLGSNDFKKICNSLKIDMEIAKEAADIIKSFYPYPGHKFSQYEFLHDQIKIPDILVKETGSSFHIELNTKGMPVLGINNFYKKLLSNTANSYTKDYIKQKLNSAAWFLQCIKKREETILDIAKSIINLQKDFFIKGKLFLKALTLNDVAQDIEKHESTVSRAIKNKYLYCKHGIFELKDFISQAGSISIKEKIKLLIKEEDRKEPYTDDKLCEMLKSLNIDIKRRTIAKYRKDMKIPRASKRKVVSLNIS
jgi:RNA polymerase sigma-54 factor